MAVKRTPTPKDIKAGQKLFTELIHLRTESKTWKRESASAFTRAYRAENQVDVLKHSLKTMTTRANKAESELKKLKAKKVAR